MLLYCRDGHVIAWYNEDPGVPESEFGPGTVLVPWPTTDTLERHPNGNLKAPVLQGKDQLISYARFRHDRSVRAAVSVDLGDKTCAVPADSDSLTHLQYLVDVAKKNAKAVVNWVDAHNQPVRLAAADIKAMTDAVTAHIRDAHDELSNIIAGIHGGTVTKQEHIDNWSA